MSRASKKQRLRLQKQRRQERERRKKGGASRAEQIETAAQRKRRDQVAREAKRLADRRAEHHIPDGRLWGMVDGRVRKTAALCRELREAGVPHFRAADEVQRVLPDGRKRTLKVPLCARAVMVGYREDEGDTPSGPDRLSPDDYHGMLALSRDVSRVHLQPSDERPRTVPAAEVVEFAETLIGQRLLTREDTAPIDVGEDVRVLSGPFASFKGIVEEITEAGLIKAAVSIFGRATPVELDPTQVERA